MTRQARMRLTDFAATDLTVEQVGSGGFGLVYMGPDRAQGGEWVALKTLRPELLALRPQLRDLFVSEGLIWVGLWPHPNLLRCLAATEIDGRIYLILDYAHHGSLRDVLTFSQSFATRLVWAQHIAAGLLALHTPDPEFLRPRPLVHRDLKPENVLVNKAGWAKITDFGLAAAMASELAVSSNATQAFALVETFAQAAHAAQEPRDGGANPTWLVARTTQYLSHGAAKGVTSGARGGVGTIQYMPPEQWQTDVEVGPPTDLYAFGLILSELLAGRHGLGDLEEARDAEAWYQLHLSGRPRPLRAGPFEGAARLPGELEALYTALLEKRPQDRPTAKEALAGLQSVAQTLDEQPYTPPSNFYPRDDVKRMAAWHNWANTCGRFERYEEALERNEQALALASDVFSIWNSRGNILAELGLQARRAGDEGQAQERLEEGLTAHTRALSLTSTDHQRAMAHTGRATQLCYLRRHVEADEACASALALDLDYGLAWYTRASIALDWGRAEAEAGQTTEAARKILAAGERYITEARRCGMTNPTLLFVLDRIRQARAQLGT